MSLIVFFTIVAVIITSILAYYNYDRYYWKRRGIPGPPPELFLGNLRELDNQKMLNIFQLREWTKVYGKVYGVTEGKHRSLVISDPDLLLEIFSKKFEYFHGRRLHPLTGDVDDPNNKLVNLFTARGSRWKKLRSISNPSLNAVNLKIIHPTIQDSINELVRFVEKIAGQEVNAFPYLQELTMDVISRVALGQEESKLFNNEFMDHVKGFFQTRTIGNPEYMAFIFPFLANSLKKYLLSSQAHNQGYIQRLRSNLKELVDKRKSKRLQNSEDIQFNDGEKRKVDFIDFILDLESEPLENEESGASDKYGVKIDRKLTTDEIVSMCQIFLLAGYDTTATSMAYAVHNLAIHPEVQKKIQEEIDEYGLSEEPSYDEIHKLKYLDAAVKESFRVYPLAARAVSRECMESVTVGDIEIEKGVEIAADVYSIHFSKEIWGEDAEMYNPDRWLTGEKRHPMAWMPFGAGPRTCIGMKLVYLEVKNVLISCLKKFNIVRTENTPDKLKLRGASLLVPESVIVKFELR